MTEIDQKEYLKRYMSADDLVAEKKKKKKKKIQKGVGDRVKIIDDDIFTTNTQTMTEEELLAANEDAPQIVGFVDERPLEMRIDDYKQSGLWKPISAIGDESSSIDNNTKINFAMANLKKGGGSSLRDVTGKSLNLSSRKTKNRQGDISSSQSNKDIDSPPRNRRRGNSTSISIADDQSPPRKSRVDDDPSPPRRRKDDDPSPPRKTRRDESPPRRRKDSDSSPLRRNRKDHDPSPPRKSRKRESPPRRPPKRPKKDESPARRIKTEPSSSRRHDSSPSRMQKREKRSVSRWGSRSPTPPKKMSKTLDGKAAGLQNAQELAKETMEFRKREDSLFRNMSAEVSGANASTVMRDRKTGKVRNLEEEAEEQRRRQKVEDENKEKYSKWGKGLKQVEDQNARLSEDLHEMSKPLARYADDEDLERFLKEQERDGDPMLAYIRKKKKKVAVEAGKPEKPQYEGEFMPNRFGIRPGCRWDGVDRSNGYEKKWFEIQNSKKAAQEEVYQWNVSDM